MGGLIIVLKEIWATKRLEEVKGRASYFCNNVMRSVGDGLK